MARRARDAAVAGVSFDGFDFRVVRPDGSVRWVWLQSGVNPARPGMVVRHDRNVVTLELDLLDPLGVGEERVALEAEADVALAREPVALRARACERAISSSPIRRSPTG